MEPIPSSDNTESTLHFLDYWRVIRLRRSLILVVFLLCVLSSALLTMWLPKQFASTAQIEVQKDTPPIPEGQSGEMIGTYTDPIWLATQFQVIKSQSILTNVINDLHLNQIFAKRFSEPPWPMDETFDYLSSKLSVDQTRLTSLIEITVRDSDKYLAADIANRIVEAYRSSRIDDWQNTRGGGIKALREDLAKRQIELSEAEANLDRQRTNFGIDELSDQSQVSDTVASEKLRFWAAQQVDVEADYIEYTNILSSLLKLPKDTLGRAFAVGYRQFADPELVEDAYAVDQAREKTLAAANDYGTNHPTYQTAERQLAQAQHTYNSKVDAIITGMQARVDQDRQRLDTVQRFEADTTEQKNQLAMKYRPYYRAKDQVETLKRWVDETERRLQDEEALVGQPIEPAKVTNPARPEKRPVSPKTMLIIPLGVVVGLVVGIALAFFIEYLDTSVKTIDDVERSLQAPVLGVIPQNVGLIIEEGPGSPHAEAYRVLQTNMLFSRKDEKWNSITVLSAGSAEGKSTTLFNLATVFAFGGKRVLVVDSDLRRPTLHHSLHCNNAMGLTDLLLKTRTLEEVIQKTKVPTLDFISSGKLPNSALSILGSPQMKELIQELKQRYEFVFFDSPPLLGVSDASILASEMDMVLQVVQYRRYPQPMTLRAKQMILKVGGNLLGIVLNNINMSQDENYYYYSGYYEYHTQPKDQSVVQVGDAAKPAKVEIKPKY